MKRILIVLITIVSLTACSNSKAPASIAPTSTAPESTSSDTAAKGVLAQIKSAGVVNIGIQGAYPPFNYIDNQKQLAGFDVDLSNEFAKRMGVKVNFVVTPWDSILAGLFAKKYDVLLSSMAITEERKQKVDFTDPYYSSLTVLFVPNNSTITDPKQLKGKNIGAELGSTFADKAKEYGGTVKNYKTDLLALQDVLTGRIDGVVTEKAVGLNVIQANNYALKALTDPPLNQEKGGIAINKGEPDLLAELNKHLKAMLDDGTYATISNKWFGEDIR